MQRENEAMQKLHRLAVFQLQAPHSTLSPAPELANGREQGVEARRRKTSPSRRQET